MGFQGFGKRLEGDLKVKLVHGSTGLMKKSVKKVLGPRVWRKLKTAWIQHQIKTFQPRQVRHYYANVELEVYLGDPISALWYDRDWLDFNVDLELLAQRRLRSGAVVFNLGAHQAVVALVMEKIVRPHGLVVAVEANRHNCEVAEKNFSLNSPECLKIVHAAVAARSGTIRFSKDLVGRVESGDSPYESEDVAAYSIDDLADCYGTPDVLYIDVEGYECQALEGAARTLQTFPDCFVEVHVNEGLEDFGGSPGSVFSHFPREHYDLIVRSDGGVYSELKSETSVIQDRFFLLALSKDRSSPLP